MVLLAMVLLELVLLELVALEMVAPVLTLAAAAAGLVVVSMSEPLDVAAGSPVTAASGSDAWLSSPPAGPAAPA